MRYARTHLWLAGIGLALMLAGYLATSAAGEMPGLSAPMDVVGEYIA